MTVYKDLELTALTTVLVPKVKVAIDFTDTDTSFTANTPILKSDGTALTGSAVLGVKGANGFVEEFYFADCSTQIVGNVATWTTRGLKKGGIAFLTSNPLLIPSTHEEGEEIFVVNSGMVHEQYQQGLNGTLEVTTKQVLRPQYGAAASGANPVFADATERDAALTAPAEGDRCRVTALGSQEYDGSAWVTFGVATPTTASLGVKKVTQDFQADLLASGGLVLSTNSIETDKASQAEAEAGTENTKVMSALRVQQAIDINAKEIVTTLNGYGGFNNFINSTNYSNFSVAQASSGVLPLRYESLIVLRNCSVKNLFVDTATASSQGARDVTIFKNGSSTALTVNLPLGNTTGNNVSDTITLVAGDYISVGFIDTNTGTSGSHSAIATCEIVYT